jgi:hypothetical protein
LSGRIFVSDPDQNSIHVFAANGSAIGTIGQLERPSSLTTLDGKIYAVLVYSGKILQIDPLSLSSNVISTLIAPQSLVNALGFLWTIDGPANARTFAKINPSSQAVTHFSAPVSASAFKGSFGSSLYYGDPYDARRLDVTTSPPSLIAGPASSTFFFDMAVVESKAKIFSSYSLSITSRDALTLEPDGILFPGEYPTVSKTTNPLLAVNDFVSTTSTF